MANAGMDESNAMGSTILLPKDSFKSAAVLRKSLMKHYGLKSLGIIITDSRTEPLKRGITGKTLGYAGLIGVKNYVGKRDLYGRKFKFESVNVVDSLAAAAVLTMGEGDECRPIALIEDSIAIFKEKINRNETIIPIKDDMYGPFLKKLKKLR
jgi:F420-0:gamma-glutamyl ligase